MRNVEFSTSKGEYYLVDFPEGADRFFPMNDRDNPYISYFIGSDTGRLYVNYPLEVVGNPKELTAKDWEDVVEETLLFKKHKVESCKFRCYQDGHLGFKDAVESGMTLLNANGVFLENQLGEKPSIKDYKNEEGGNQELFIHNLNEWKEAQDKVWKNPIIFRIKE